MLPPLTSNKLYHRNLQDLLSELSELNSTSEEGNAIINELCNVLENSLVATNSELVATRRDNEVITDIINKNITDDEERESLHKLLNLVQTSISENISFGKRISDGFKKMLIDSKDTSFIGSMRSGFMDSLPPGMQSLIGGLGNKLFNNNPSADIEERLKKNIREQLLRERESKTKSDTFQKTNVTEVFKENTSFVPVNNDYIEDIKNTIVNEIKLLHNSLTDEEKTEFINAINEKDSIIEYVKSSLEEFGLDESQQEDANTIVEKVFESLNDSNYRDKENLEVYQRETIKSYSTIEEQQTESNEILKDIRNLLSTNNTDNDGSIFDSLLNRINPFNRLNRNSNIPNNVPKSQMPKTTNTPKPQQSGGKPSIQGVNTKGGGVVNNVKNVFGSFMDTAKNFVKNPVFNIAKSFLTNPLTIFAGLAAGGAMASKKGFDKLQEMKLDTVINPFDSDSTYMSEDALQEASGYGFINLADMGVSHTGEIVDQEKYDAYKKAEELSQQTHAMKQQDTSIIPESLWGSENFGIRTWGTDNAEILSTYLPEKEYEQFVNEQIRKYTPERINERLLAGYGFVDGDIHKYGKHIVQNKETGEYEGFKSDDERKAFYEDKDAVSSRVSRSRYNQLKIIDEARSNEQKFLLNDGSFKSTNQLWNYNGYEDRYQHIMNGMTDDEVSNILSTTQGKFPEFLSDDEKKVLADTSLSDREKAQKLEIIKLEGSFNTLLKYREAFFQSKNRRGYDGSTINAEPEYQHSIPLSRGISLDSVYKDTSQFKLVNPPHESSTFMPDLIVKNGDIQSSLQNTDKSSIVGDENIQLTQGSTNISSSDAISQISNGDMSRQPRQGKPINPIIGTQSSSKTNSSTQNTANNITNVTNHYHNNTTPAQNITPQQLVNGASALSIHGGNMRN